MPSAVDGPSRRFLQASGRAWAIMVAGGVCMTVSLLSLSGWDRYQPATVKSTPWVSLFLWAAACMLFLAGSNADATEYSGKNGGRK